MKEPQWLKTCKLALTSYLWLQSIIASYFSGRFAITMVTPLTKVITPLTHGNTSDNIHLQPSAQILLSGFLNNLKML